MTTKDQNKKQDDIEVDIEAEDQIEIEVVDDTPEADRGRKPLAKDALAVDDEAEEYSAGVKKRLGELRHQTHDERRRKEEAQRERDEAIAFAKQAMARAQKLEQQLTYGEASYAEEVTKKSKLAVAQAKEKHAKAFEAGDAVAMAEAIAEIAAAAQEEANALRWSATAQQKAQNALQQEKSGVDLPETHQPARKQDPITPDERATEWAKQNAWFGNEPDMTALVYGVHERLVKSGISPVDDADKYYSTIDEEMRRRFPEYEWQDDGAARKPAKTTSGKPKSAPVVAPVTRSTSSTGKGKVTLTQTQVRMANKFGLTLEQMAREVLKLEQENGAAS